jgi:N-acylglucosamine-6-phosphate 2-epimerase
MAAQVRALPRGVIVSCQAYEGEPLFGASIMAAMARAALEGGAVGIRANSPADIAAIRAVTDRPLIGLYKLHTPSSPVYITPTRAAAAAVAQAGCDIIAIDATDRPRPNGETLHDLIRYIHEVLRKPVMADVSCMADAERAETLGADTLSTTLAGYTKHGRPPLGGPDVEFLDMLVQRSRLPVVAEGRYRDPADVARAFELGAYAVVIGGAITRPQDITRRFVQAVPAGVEHAS